MGLDALDEPGGVGRPVAAVGEEMRDSLSFFSKVECWLSSGGVNFRVHGIFGERHRVED